MKMNKRHIFSFVLLAVYAFILLHDVIPHHHHNGDSTCQIAVEAKTHSHEHSSCCSHSHEQEKECDVSHQHSHEDDCEGACNFFIEVLKSDFLSNTFIASNNKVILNTSEKDLCNKWGTKAFIYTSKYSSANSLRGPPAFHI